MIVPRMWMDVPNTFPWRRCLKEYMNLLITIGCNDISEVYPWPRPLSVEISVTSLRWTNRDSSSGLTQQTTRDSYFSRTTDVSRLTVTT